LDNQERNPQLLIERGKCYVHAGDESQYRLKVLGIRVCVETVREPIAEIKFVVRNLKTNQVETISGHQGFLCECDEYGETVETFDNPQTRKAVECENEILGNILQLFEGILLGESHEYSHAMVKGTDTGVYHVEVRQIVEYK